MGGSKTTTSNSTATVAPPSWTAPGMEELAGKVTDAVSKLPQTPYSGNFVATPDYSAAVASEQGTAGLAQNLSDFITGNLGTAKPNYNYTTSMPSSVASAQTGATDPTLMPALSAALSPLTQALDQSLLAQRGSAAASGAYSGSRAQAVLPALAYNDYSRNASNTLATLANTDYNSAQDRAITGYNAETARAAAQQSAMQTYVNSLPALVSSALSSSAGAGDVLTQAADLQAAQSQAGINNALAQQQYATTAPFQGLDIATALLRQLSSNYGTTTASGTQTTSSSGAGDILGGVIGGLSTLASIPTGGSTTLGGKVLGSIFK